MNLGVNENPDLERGLCSLLLSTIHERI